MTAPVIVDQVKCQSNIDRVTEDIKSGKQMKKVIFPATTMIAGA